MTNDDPSTAEQRDDLIPQPSPDSSKGGGAERRREPRVSGDFAIRVAGSDAAPSRIKDLSKNGLCCFHHEPIEEMQLLQIHLEIPGAPDSPEGHGHLVKGAVVRCDPRDDGEKGFELAVYFTELPSLTRLAIDRFVQSQLGR